MLERRRDEFFHFIRDGAYEAVAGEVEIGEGGAVVELGGEFAGDVVGREV